MKAAKVLDQIIKDIINQQKQVRINKYKKYHEINKIIIKINNIFKIREQLMLNIITTQFKKKKQEEGQCIDVDKRENEQIQKSKKFLKQIIEIDKNSEAQNVNVQKNFNNLLIDNMTNVRSSNKSYENVTSSNGQKNIQAYQDESQDEGFSKKQIPLQVNQILLQTISANGFFSQKIKNKKKIIFNGPLSLYAKVDLYIYPPSLDTLPYEIEEQQSLIDKNYHEQKLQHNNNFIIKKNLEQSQNEQARLIKKLLINKIQKKEDVQKCFLAHNGQPYAKIIQFISNNKMTCIYNRHSQLLTNKNDLTIYIRNIKSTVQADMLRSFDKNLFDICEPETQRSNKIQIIPSKSDIAGDSYFYLNNSQNLNQIQVYSYQKQISPKKIQVTSIHNLKSYSFKHNNYNINSITQLYSNHKNPLSHYQNVSGNLILNAQSKSEYKVILKFYSNFQSGNLHSVFKQSGTDNYYLFLQNDINTHGYNQWFNFWIKAQISYQNQLSKKTSYSKSIVKRSQSKRPAQSIRGVYRPKFIIVNISKDIKYNENMNILTYSFNNQQWQYNTPFIYYKNRYQRYNGLNYTTIQFQYEFILGEAIQSENDKRKNDFVQFSLTYPYTYSRMITFIKEIKIIQSKKWNIEIEVLTKSQCNNQIYLIKITKKQIEFLRNSQSGLHNQKKINKKCVVVLARQHPGQPISSYICQQLIKIIIFSPLEIQQQSYDWFIIPMANPDGVIHGNSRTNMKGYDINRCWDKNNLFLSVEVEAINNFIIDLKKTYHISYLIDLHGHSKDFDAFAYFSQDNQKNKILNFMLSQKCCFFNYYKSKFGISYKKRPTFRGQMFYRQQIKNSITIETSLYGFGSLTYNQNISKQKRRQKKKTSQMTPFTYKNFIQLASSIYNVLIQYQQLKQLPRDRQKQKFSNKNFHDLRKQVLLKILELQKLRQKYQEKDQNTQIDSDSDPEDQYLENVQRIGLGLQSLQKAQHNEQRQSDEQKEDKIISFGNLYSKGKSGNQTQQQSKRRIITNQRYSLIRKKNETFKHKRKPIYTNSNVQFLSYQKLIQYQKSIKKYSMDQSNQFLSRKKLTETSEKTGIRYKRAQSSNSQLNFNQTLTKYDKNNSINSKGKLMRSQPILLYPTVCNVKYNIEKVIQFQEKDELYQSTKNWIMNQKSNINSYRFKLKQKKSDSVDQKNKKIQKCPKNRPESHFKTISSNLNELDLKNRYNYTLNHQKNPSHDVFTSTGTAIQRVKRQKNYTSIQNRIKRLNLSGENENFKQDQKHKFQKR